MVKQGNTQIVALITNMDWWIPTPRHPPNVLKAVRDHGIEAYKEHVSVWVGEGPEPVVVLLARRIKQTQGEGLVADGGRW